VAGGLGSVLGPVVGALLFLLILGLATVALYCSCRAAWLARSSCAVPIGVSTFREHRVELLIFHAVVSGLIVGGVYALIGLSLNILLGPSGC